MPVQLKYLYDDVVHIIIRQLMVFIGTVRFYRMQAGSRLNKLFGFKFTRNVRVVRRSDCGNLVTRCATAMRMLRYSVYFRQTRNDLTIVLKPILTLHKTSM